MTCEKNSLRPWINSFQRCQFLRVDEHINLNFREPKVYCWWTKCWTGWDAGPFQHPSSPFCYVILSWLRLISFDVCCIYNSIPIHIRNVDLYILLRSICMNSWCMYTFTNADRPTYASVGFVTLLTIQSRLSISSPWPLQDVEAQNSGSKFWITNIEMWWLSSRIICFQKGLYFRMRY